MVALAERCTVVVVSYQCRGPLLRCLASLQRQSDVADLHIIVVDNASGDGTVEAVRARFPAVAVVANAGNVGFSKAANQGIALANPGQVLVLNPDTELPPGSLVACLARLDACPRVGVLGCKLVRTDGSIDRASKRNVPTPRNTLRYVTGLDRLLGARPDSYNPPLPDYDVEGETGALCGAFLLVRAAALAEVGGLDEAFWMYGEDIDWCMRFRAAGWGVHYAADVSVLHLKGASSASGRSLRVTYAFAHAMWVFFDKHRPAGTSPVLLLAVRAGIVAHFVLSVLRSKVTPARARLTVTA